MNRRLLSGGAAAAVSAALLAACAGHGAPTSSSSGSGGSGGAGSSTTTGGGASATSSGSATGTGGASEHFTYPDIAALHDLGVSRTCSLNQGVCHGAKEHPDLTTPQDFLATVGMPCQLGAQDPSTTLDQCEVPGDLLNIGGADDEILLVTVPANEPYPPKHVTLKLAATPAGTDPSSAKIRRMEGGKETFAKLLTGVTIAPGMDPQHLVLTLTSALDPDLADFMDTRAFHGDRVRMGDPNDNGMAHSSSTPWQEVYPGDPSRSMLYLRLIDDKYGPVMPLIPRTWTPDATRAIWCWIRGLPAGTTPDKLDVHDPIVYKDCPPDPNAPDPNATGGWPAVKLLMAAKCATSLCHSPETHMAGLDLTPTPDVFAKQVINVGTTQVPGTLRVVPGQPAASYLMCKVDPKCMARQVGTGVMPLGQTGLSDAELKTISDWIVNGAPTQ